ncbi:MAG: glucokinase [Acidobacteriota bacterium]
MDGERPLLVADIGGTNTRLALVALARGRAPVAERSYPSRAFASFEDIAVAFLAETSTPVRLACLGVAGPVLDGRCTATNLPWTLDEGTVASRLGVERAWLINDLEATAWSIPWLEPCEAETIQAGAPAATGNLAVIAAGTGLGEAGAYWDGVRHHPFATEGGHADFAPRDEEQEALLRFARRKYGRVSWERVVSGPGLDTIHGFVLAEVGSPEPDWLAAARAGGDPAAAISTAALEGRSPLAARALSLFVRLYGSEAGNLALTLKASGGVFVAGGIAPQIMPALRAYGFLEAFLDKGRMRALLQAFPVRVVLDPRAGLLGAARYAALHASE